MDITFFAMCIWWKRRTRSDRDLELDHEGRVRGRRGQTDQLLGVRWSPVSLLGSQTMCDSGHRMVVVVVVVVPSGR